jgi:mono/diheme cytochrome c family protein
MRRWLTVALIALSVTVGGVACGGDDDSGSETTTTETTTETTTDETTTETESAAGRDIFVTNCGACHTLSDAGTSGTTGPALDGSGRSEAEIETQVREGGGAMPPFEGQLSDEEISAVAEYVASQS